MTIALHRRLKVLEGIARASRHGTPGMITELLWNRGMALGMFPCVLTENGRRVWAREEVARCGMKQTSRQSR